jgi:hypothetical protein
LLAQVALGNPQQLAGQALLTQAAVAAAATAILRYLLQVALVAEAQVGLKQASIQRREPLILAAAAAVVDHRRLLEHLAALALLSLNILHPHPQSPFSIHLER